MCACQGQGEYSNVIEAVFNARIIGTDVMAR
jgi:hypothetical protein